ncbi:hypothetical protein QBC39DRAFT_349868 [Podospora conica]|nr:hypothetical protein QBC39DRAFT_349868 [Schizothecium conicum]
MAARPGYWLLATGLFAGTGTAPGTARGSMRACEDTKKLPCLRAELVLNGDGDGDDHLAPAQHGTQARHGYGCCPFIQRLFLPHHSVCGGFHYPRACLARPGHAPCPSMAASHGLGRRYVPDPRLDRIHHHHDDSIESTPALRVNPPVSTPPRDGDGAPSHSHPPQPSTAVHRGTPSLELGQDGDPNGLGRTASVDCPSVPWSIRHSRRVLYFRINTLSSPGLGT